MVSARTLSTAEYRAAIEDDVHTIETAAGRVRAIFRGREEYKPATAPELHALASTLSTAAGRIDAQRPGERFDAQQTLVVREARRLSEALEALAATAERGGTGWHFNIRAHRSRARLALGGLERKTAALRRRVGIAA